MLVLGITLSHDAGVAVLRDGKILAAVNEERLTRQKFATGIPAGATVTAQIGDRTGLVPQYAGPAPGIPGVQQVNVAVPGDLAPGATQLMLCAAVGGQQYCSPAYALVTN